MRFIVLIALASFLALVALPSMNGAAAHGHDHVHDCPGCDGAPPSDGAAGADLPPGCSPMGPCAPAMLLPDPGALGAPVAHAAPHPWPGKTGGRPVILSLDLPPPRG